MFHRLLFITTLVALFSSSAAQSKVLCTWDIGGSMGEVTNLMKTYRLKTLAQGQSFDLRSYQDEAEVLREFEAGRCDVAAISDIQARAFNPFSGSISAIGAMTDYGDLQILMSALASPRLGSRLGDDKHQVLGILPLGTAFLFVNDRGIDTVEELAGRRVGTLPGHRDAEYMLQDIKAIPVPTTVSRFAGEFNSGALDVVYAPAAAYNYLELYRGMGSLGGVVRYPVGLFSLQLIARTGEFDEAFIRQSRRVLAGMYSQAMVAAQQHEQSIPPDRWINISQTAIRGYEEMIRQVRLEIMKGDAGAELAAIYDPVMLRLMRKIRCYNDMAASECTAREKE